MIKKEMLEAKTFLYELFETTYRRDNVRENRPNPPSNPYDLADEMLEETIDDGLVKPKMVTKNGKKTEGIYITEKGEKIMTFLTAFAIYYNKTVGRATKTDDMDSSAAGGVLSTIYRQGNTGFIDSLIDDKNFAEAYSAAKKLQKPNPK